MMRNRRTRMGMRGILPLALLAGGVYWLMRRNRSTQHQMQQGHMYEQHNPMSYETRNKLQREVEIMEEADNRMFDNFPQD